MASAATGIPSTVRDCRKAVDASCYTDSGLLAAGGVLGVAGYGLGVSLFEDNPIWIASLGLGVAGLSYPSVVDKIIDLFGGGDAVGTDGSDAVAC